MNPIISESAARTLFDPPGRWEVAIDGWRPASLNELLARGPFGASRLKKLDRDYVILFSRISRVPPAQTKRRISLRIVLPPRQRRWDIDALQKSTLDACKHAHLIKDDHPRWAEWGGVKYTRGAGLATTIVVEDM